MTEDRGAPRLLQFRGELVRLRRHPLVKAALALPVLLPALVAFALRDVGGSAAFGASAEALLFGIIGAFLLWNANPWPRRDVVKVEADARGLEVEGTMLAREGLRDGFVVPLGGETRVVVNRRGIASKVELLAQGVGEARRVLIALGFDASQTVARFRTLSRIFADLRYLLAVALIPFLTVFAMSALFRGHHANLGAFPSVAFFLPLLAFAFLGLVPSRITVGADGVEVRWLGRRRFVAHKEIVDATQYTAGWGNSRYTGVALWLESGEELRIPVGQARRIQNADDRTRMILERIHEAAGEAKRETKDLDPEILARGDRELDVWMRALRSLGAGANATMRTAPIEIERFWRLVEDPGAEAVARAAAAVALTADHAAESRRRLRAAAEQTAAPRLRIAIDAAASHDEEALREALADLEAEDAARKRA